MPSLFSKIISGEIPSHKVWEDSDHFAFLDIRPFAPGHTLLVPKREEDYLFDLSAQRTEALWSAARKVATLLKTRLGCVRVVVMVLGYEISHAHIHLIPTQTESDVLPPRPGPTDHQALAEMASKIRGHHTTSAPLPDTEAVEARWDDFATLFVSKMEETTLKIARGAIDQLQLNRAEVGLEVLEVGCGGGGAGLELYRQLKRAEDASGYPNRLTLSDISAEMIAIARSRVQREGLQDEITLVKADAQALPFESNRFDRYFSCLNLMLVPDPSRALGEANRVLKDEGVAVWVVWGRPDHSALMILLPEAIREVGLDLPQPPRSNFHLGGLDVMRGLLKEAGFARQRMWYQQMPTDCERGEVFAEMILSERPELNQLIESDTQRQALWSVLSKSAQARLDDGEPLGLDTLIVVARKSPAQP